MSREERYVIGIDSSTQSVKAIVWAKDGTAVAEGRAPLDILQPDAMRAEQNAEDWWRSAVTAIRQVTGTVDPALIDGIAISNQRETMALVDADGKPLAPATLWLDRRAAEITKVMAAEIGDHEMHRISGKPVDCIPCVYRLRWYREYMPELLDSAAGIVDVHGFLTRRLTGTSAATWTSADPFGILDIHEKQWSRTILDHLKIPTTKLPRLLRPGERVGAVIETAAAETGLKAGTPVFAGGGDGQCAGLGVGAIKPGVVYLNLGTAVVGGVWSPTAEISNAWRTLVSPTGDGYILESVQRAGAFFVNWFVDNFAGGRSEATFRRLEEAGLKMPVGSEGVTVCSHLMGCLDPYWDIESTATFTGLGPQHTQAHLYRAGLEAITLEFARALKLMRAAGLSLEQILVIGGGADSRLWLKIVADSTGLPVVRSLSNEASALGAGISAAVGSGWFPSFDTAVGAMTRVAERIEPDLSAAPQWEALSRKQAAVYFANRHLEEVAKHYQVG